MHRVKLHYIDMSFIADLSHSMLYNFSAELIGRIDSD